MDLAQGLAQKTILTGFVSRMAHVISGPVIPAARMAGVGDGYFAPDASLPSVGSSAASL